MPALVSSVEWSSARGMRDAEGRRRCPFSSKKARKPSRSSAVVCTAAILGVELLETGRRGRYPRAVSLDVLIPVERRRRRRRYRARRIVLLLLAVLATAVAGAWYMRHAATTKHHPAASSHLRHRSVTKTVADSPPQAPLRLLQGAPLLEGKLHVRLAAPAAILVDAHTGHVLWAKRAHDRRKIAS